ncbi:uncharacterized protein LOC105846151 isoform X1 [Hydra vulgaris]|uniref:uncharacterized protein LOC105846151 isoform X1 n=1 Tax=Hydra vulgaris TaxID=6087 RepID=UPI001F5F074B|nr:uncharacterized protein LOC105846151 isoform X1 [Hydra vulgaris]
MSIYEYFEKLDFNAAERYKNKLAILGINQCPYKFPADAWKDDPTEWPSVQYHDVYHYLIKSPKIFSPEAIDNYKALDAYKYFVSGWVQEVLHMILSSGFVIFKAEVKPSYRTNDPTHTPWIAVNNKGSIILSHCNCMAGLGETCSHVAAVLYKLEAAVRLGLTSKSCTDVPCKWNQNFTKDVNPAPISEIIFYSADAKQKIRSNISTASLTVRLNEEHQTRFLESIKKNNPKVVALSLFEGFQKPFVSFQNYEPARLPKTLRSLYLPSYANLSKENLSIEAEKLFNSLSITTQQLKYLEEVTRNQSSSISWYEHRCGRITGSVMHDVLKASIENPPKSLVRKLTKPNFCKSNTPSLIWGRENEEFA